MQKTKKSMLASGLAVLVCVAMLIGTTFAWFTDSVTNGKNTIKAGNLDVELSVRGEDGLYTPVTKNTELFDKNALWEPGYTQTVYLKIENMGSLALKYQFAVNVVRETEGTNVNGETFKLSDYLVFGKAVNDTEVTYADREAAWEAAGTTLGLEDYSDEQVLLPDEVKYVALVVYMPTTVGNEANYRGDIVPSIELGVNLNATQAAYETDGFGNNDYDENVSFPVMVSTADELSAALSEPGTNIVLSDNFPEAALMLSSSSGAITNVTLDGNGMNLTGGMSVASNTAIDNLTIQNFNFTTKGFEVNGWGTNITLKNVVIRNCSFRSITSTSLSAIHLNVSENEVENFTVENCIIDGVTNTSGSGIYVGTSTGSVVVQGCTIQNTAHSGIQISNHTGTVTITENTIKEWNSDNDSNGGYGINAVYQNGDNKFAAITNNVFQKRFVAGAEDEGKIIRMRYSTLGLKDVDLDWPESLGDLSNSYYQVTGNDYSSVLAATKQP